MILFALMLGILGQAASECDLPLENMKGKYPPLLLHDGDFILPDTEERIIKIGEGQDLELYCHGSVRYDAVTYVKLSGAASNKSMRATCREGLFFVNDNQVNVGSATCNRKQEPRLTRSKEVCSPVGADGRTSDLEDLVLAQIGWLINGQYKEQIRLCIDEKVYGTLWTTHNVTANIEFRDKDDSRPGFRIDNRYLKRFYTWTASYKMNGYYSKKTQESTMKKLLGSNVINGELLIESSTSGTNYFAKGHLSPDASFFYNIFQDATYYFMNVAPQFQSFNNANWKALEGSVRDYASKMKTDMTVYTGTHGVLAYPDLNNNEVDIYLHNAYIPAPEYYWKVVIEPSSGQGVAFIGLNDPHATEAPEKLCNNVCSQIDWVDWSVTEIDAGYMYCCTVEEANEAVPSMPDLQTTGLLQMNAVP